MYSTLDRGAYIEHTSWELPHQPSTILILYDTVGYHFQLQLHNLIFRLMMKEFQLFGKQPADIKNLIGQLYVH